MKQTLLIFFLLCSMVALSMAIDPVGPPISSVRDAWTSWSKQNTGSNLVVFDLYVDLLCSDSAAWWSSVFKQLDDYYQFSNQTLSEKNAKGAAGGTIRVNLHLLPLPYHISSYAGSMAYVLLNKHSNYDPVIMKKVVDSFFYNQAPLYNNVVSQMTQPQMINLIYNNNIKSLNVISQSQFVSGMNDVAIDMRTRTLFKLSTSRAVFATPSFYVNNVPIQNGEDFTAKDWINLFNTVIDKQ